MNLPVRKQSEVFTVEFTAAPTTTKARIKGTVDSPLLKCTCVQDLQSRLPFKGIFELLLPTPFPIDLLMGKTLPADICEGQPGYLLR